MILYTFLSYFNLRSMCWIKLLLIVEMTISFFRIDQITLTTQIFYMWLAIFMLSRLQDSVLKSIIEAWFNFHLIKQKNFLIKVLVSRQQVKGIFAVLIISTIGKIYSALNAKLCLTDNREKSTENLTWADKKKMKLKKGINLHCRESFPSFPISREWIFKKLHLQRKHS